MVNNSSNLDWHNLLRIACAFILPFILCHYLIPTVNKIARKRGALNSPNERTSHRYATPNLGGVSIFLSFIISFLLFLKGDCLSTISLAALILSLILIFFIGLTDDLRPLYPEQKFMCQILVAVILSFNGYGIDNLYGFLDIFHLDPLRSALLSVFVYTAIINAINMIDGLDGLAALIGIGSLSILSFWFYACSLIDLSVFCIAMLACLSSFFFFNVFGLRNKTFMGDSGSLLLGVVICVAIFEFGKLNQNIIGPLHAESAPALMLGLVFIPIFDLIRVCIIRIAAKQSPFKADRRHAHHMLCNIGYSHLKVGIILGSINFLAGILGFFLRNFGIIYLLIIYISSAFLLSLMLHFSYNKSLKKRKALI